jgi:hypothetical protein
MSKIVKVSNGDYSLQVQAGGNIILDTTGTAIGRGNSYGTVTVYGNLDVKGATTYIETTNSEIKDNILQLNYGDTGSSGITLTQAGIEIERGANTVTYPAVQLVFNESVAYYDSTSVLSNPNIGGSFVLKTSGNTLNALQLRTISTDTTGDLSFDLQGGNEKVAIVNYNKKVGIAGGSLTQGANDYANSGLSSWHVPNVQFVYNYVVSSYTPGGPPGMALVNTVVWPLTTTGSVTEGAAANILATGTLTPSALPSTYNIQFSVNAGILGYFSTATGTTAGPISANGSGSLTVNNVRLYNNSITNINNSYNLTLTSGSGEVEVNAVLDLDNQAAPTYASGKTKLYSSSTIGPGRTGVYVTNSTVQTPDELISRSRAVLLSILL